jgi:hypothetical protein
MIKIKRSSAWTQEETKKSGFLYKDFCSERRVQKKINIQTIITVCTKDLIHEIREFVTSARVCFPNFKIVVFTDVVDLAIDLLKEFDIKNIEFKNISLDDHPSEILDIKSISSYWKREPIWFKLKGLRDEVELSKGKGVLICDSDITFKRGFLRDFYGDVALSPFYWGDRFLKISEEKLLRDRDGEFNAGMLATNSIEFCDWWIDAYKSGLGGFYEQKCLDYVPSLFDVDYIGPEHNFGKWRSQIPKDNISSFHYHIKERARKKEDSFIKLEAQKSAAKARSILKNDFFM